MTVVLPIFGFIQLFFLAVIAYYLTELRRLNCECALQPPYRLLYATIWFLIGVRVILLLAQMVNGVSRASLLPMMIVVSFITLAFYMTSIYFIVRLYQLKCGCSPQVLQLIYLLYSIFKVCWIVFLYIFMASLYLSMRR